MDRNVRQRRWPYLALTVALAAILIMGAAFSFGWLSSNDQPHRPKSVTATGDEPQDPSDDKVRPADNTSNQRDPLNDPCSAVPRQVVTDLMGDVEPIPNSPNQQDRNCKWTGPVEGDPDVLREIRITLHGMPNVEPTFAQMQETLTGAGYTKTDAPSKGNDDALAWIHQDEFATTAGILLTRGGTMATIEVLGARYANGNRMPTADDTDGADSTLGDMARTVAEKIALPDKSSLEERVDNTIRSRNVESVHESPENPEACAVSKQTLRKVLGKKYEKSAVGDDNFCAWSPSVDTRADPSFSGLEARVYISVHQMKDNPAGASIYGMREPQGHGIDLYEVQFSESLGKEYGEPGEASLLVATTVNRMPNGDRPSLARVAFRVNDTTVRVEYTGYMVDEDGGQHEADPAVMKKNALAVTKDLVRAFT